MNQAADATLVPAAPTRTVLGQPRGLVTLFMTEMWAGFSFFYMGISLGALLGSVLVPLLAAWLGWRWGFALPALGMGLGLAQFLWTRHYLGTAGLAAAEGERGSWTPVIVFLALLAGVALALLTGLLRIDAVVLADSTSWAMLALGVAYFVYLLFFARLTRVERNRVLVMVALVAASVLLWAGYGPAGASL